MGRYGAYPAYKASGVAWLGEIPAHWRAVPIKRHLLSRAGAIKTGPFGSQLLSSEMNDTEVKVYNQRTVLDSDFEQGDNYISEEKFRELSAFQVFPGDFLVTTRGTIGRCAIVPESSERGILHPCLMRLQLDRDSLDVNFLKYLVQDAEIVLEQLLLRSNATTIEVIYSETLKTVLVPTPPLPEQQAIARFLDYKTAQIDALIARKEALLARLADKRTALISQAVTKGLDPAAPIKDSGIEWLGEIPAHWEIVRFSHFIDFQEGPGIMAADFHEDGIPLLRIVNLKPGYVDLEGCNFLDPEKVKAKWQHFRVSENDLLISSSASTGLVSLVDDISAGSIPYTGIIRLRPARDDVRRTYIEVFVGSELFATQINLLKTGTTIQHYGPIHLRQMKLPLPPPNEQEQISEFVMSMSSEIDGQSATIRSAIDKLKQYRTALITHAVTGKIDVRGIVIPVVGSDMTFG